MPIARRILMVLVSLCAAGALGFVLWQSRDFAKNPPSANSGQTPIIAKRAILDTSYRPAPPPTGNVASEVIRPELAEMLEKGTTPTRRIELLDSFDGDLTEAEAMAMIRELSSIPPEEKNSSKFSTYIHKLCNRLQKSAGTRDQFAEALATVAANRGIPIVYRDYAFQHLRILWRESRDESDTAGQRRMEAIENTFRDLPAGQPEIAAQSLLGLHEIREVSGNAVVNDEEISRVCDTILHSPPAPESIASRMTAVRVLAERRIPESSFTLREIAASPKEHALVRASAVAALGFIGEKSDLEFLESMPSDDPVIAGALHHATKRR